MTFMQQFHRMGRAYSLGYWKQIPLRWKIVIGMLIVSYTVRHPIKQFCRGR